MHARAHTLDQPPVCGTPRRACIMRTRSVQIERAYFLTHLLTACAHFVRTQSDSARAPGHVARVLKQTDTTHTSSIMHTRCVMVRTLFTACTFILLFICNNIGHSARRVQGQTVRDLKRLLWARQLRLLSSVLSLTFSHTHTQIAFHLPTNTQHMLEKINLPGSSFE